MPVKQMGGIYGIKARLKLVMGSGLIILASATRSALAVKLAGDGVSDVGQLLLLLLKVLSVGGSGWR